MCYCFIKLCWKIHMWNWFLSLLCILKSKSEKTRQLHCFLSHEALIVAKNLTKEGQNKMSLALIWGIVHSCRSNMIRDMMKNLKNWYFKKCQILQFSAFIKFASKNETTLLLPISSNIDCSPKTDKIWSKGNVFSFDLRYSTLL